MAKINKEIKILVRRKFTGLERVKKSIVDEEILQEARQLQQSLKETYQKTSAPKSKKKRKKITSKEIYKENKKQIPSKQTKQTNKVVIEEKERKKPRKKSKKPIKDSKTLTDFFKME